MNANDLRTEIEITPEARLQAKSDARRERLIAFIDFISDAKIKLLPKTTGNRRRLFADLLRHFIPKMSVGTLDANVVHATNEMIREAIAIRNEFGPGWGEPTTKGYYWIIPNDGSPKYILWFEPAFGFVTESEIVKLDSTSTAFIPVIDPL